MSGLPVAEVMDTWTKQMGYPVLDLSVSEPNAKLTQKRFLLDPKADANMPTSPFGLVMDKEIITVRPWSAYHWVKYAFVTGTSGQSQSNGVL